jgi:hypothetical protein
VSSPRERPTLSQARAKLQELGYLQGSVERFVFRRALEGAARLFLPVALAGALALSLAETAAVCASQFRYAESPRATILLSGQLFCAALLPSAAFAVLLFAAARRSRRPGSGATAFGFFAATAVLLLWVFGTWRLGPDRRGAALLWGIPVSLAALLFGAITRTTFLARAFASSGRLPERPRRAILLFAVAGALSAAAVLFAGRREPVVPESPLPSPRVESVVVVAVDGLALDAHRPDDEAVARVLAGGATGFWEARSASPAEIWTDLATGLPASRHGVRALEWVRPVGLPPLRPPFGTSWYLRGIGLAAGAVSRAPVSARERRSLAFWEVAASAGLPALAVGWWASGPWSGAAVVENREVLARSASGLDVDAVAIREFERLSGGRALSTVYLPGADILRDDRSARAAALARVALFLGTLVARARRGEVALIVLAEESHPPPGSIGRMVVFDGRTASPTTHIRREDVAPSVLARSGVPAARDLPGRPIPLLFRPGSLETTTVATYGERAAPATEPRRDTDREYLEKLRSLGYLQ